MRRVAVLIGVAAAVLSPALASAYRAPTEAETGELTAAAQRYVESAYSTPEKLERLQRIRVSTRDENRASAATETTGFSPFLYFQRISANGWEVTNGSDGCLYPKELHIPADIALELGACRRGPSPRPQPVVVCISRSSPVERPVGFYSIRPRACNFHQRGKPAAYAYMVQMRQIRWLHWGQRMAVGKGQSPTNMVGLVNAKVKLSAPRTVCGRRVFTRASFKFGSHGFGPGLELDRRFERC